MYTTRCHNRKHRLPASGQAMVEFALMLPLFFMLVFVLIELGIVISIYVGLTNSAREAARAGSTYQYQQPANPTGTPDTTVVDDEREAAIDQVITTTLNPMIDDTQLVIAYDYEPDAPSSNHYRYGDKVIVNLSYTHQYFFNLIGTSVTLSASSAMRLEPGGR